jgi:hypothetical protein
MRAAIAASFCTVLTVTLVSTGSASGSGSPTEACPSTGDQVLTVAEADGASATGCDLEGMSVVSTSGTVVVPEVGEVISLTDMMSNGAETGLTVGVTPDGTVEIEMTHESAPSTSGEDSEASLDPQDIVFPHRPPPIESNKCNSSLYALTGTRWGDTSPEWRINQGTIPTAEVSVAGAVTSIRTALGNVVHQENGCGFGDATTISGTYLGDTNVVAPISFDSAGNSVCMANSTRDGLNEVQFGQRGSKQNSIVLATTCARRNYRDGIDQTAEVDMEIASSFAAFGSRPAFAAGWTNYPNASYCEQDRDFDLQGVATHEFGHWYGLAHVTDDSQLMFPNPSKPCATDWRYLGRGDILGMRALY